MKVASLVFDFDIDKVKETGRFWADKVYSRNVSEIFAYSSASYATFLKYNPNIPLELYTNNVELLTKCMEEYDVDLSNVSYFDIGDKILEWKKHWFAFNSILEWQMYIKNSDEYVIRMDNDLIWKGALPINIDEERDMFVWKFERFVKDGNPKMGEILVCETVLNTTDFKEFNIGTLGLPKNYPMDEFRDITEQMINVDIYPVSDLGVHVWHVCEQTAHSWMMHKYRYNIIETASYVEHYYDDKLKCIEKAQYLKKK
jgi:hypothetical protein